MDNLLARPALQLRPLRGLNLLNVRLNLPLVLRVWKMSMTREGLCARLTIIGEALGGEGGVGASVFVGSGAGRGGGLRVALGESWRLPWGWSSLRPPGC